MTSPRARAFFWITVAVLALPVSAQTDLETLREHVIAYYSADTGGRTGPVMSEALAALESDARQITAEDFLLGSGLWSDIDYDEVPSGVWSPWDHFRRLIIMAKAYETPGQGLYKDPALLKMIERSLNALGTFYGAGENTPGNWWFWSIGPALDLGPTLVLVGDDIQPSVLESATKVLEARIGPRPGVTNDSMNLTGQNRVWSAMNHLMLAILREDDDRMVQVRNAFTLELVPSPSGFDGMKNDYSFHQHGPQLYTGGYGGAFAFEVSKYLLFTRDTAWAPSVLIDRHIFNYMVDGIAWSLYQNYFDASVIGREIAYTTASGFNGLAALLQASAVPSERQEEVSEAAAKMLQSWDGPLRTELAAIALTLGDVEPVWPSGFRVYPDSDHVIHRRPGWFASVRMFSSRTLSGESVNDENLVGSRQSDGFMYLVVDGDEYFTDAVRPTLDWTRLPGITVEHWPGAANAEFGRGRRTFVGGVTNGRNGVAAMDLAPIESDLTARKAWIFLDDSIVFLTSEVTLLSDNHAETIVDQRPERSEDPLVVDGVEFTDRNLSGDFRWAAGDGVGYFFPGSETISIREEVRFGSWVTLARTNPQGSVTNRIRTIWIDHGPTVTGGSAEYVIVPNVTAAAMEQWADAEPVTILRNDAIASAARDERTGEVGIVFWQGGSLEGVMVDRPALVHRSVDGAMITLAVADPARAGTKLRVTLDESLRLVSGLATVERAFWKTTLEIPVSGGRTSKVVLSRSFRPRAVRR